MRLVEVALYRCKLVDDTMLCVLDDLIVLLSRSKASISLCLSSGNTCNIDLASELQGPALEESKNLGDNLEAFKH